MAKNWRENVVFSPYFKYSPTYVLSFSCNVFPIHGSKVKHVVAADYTDRSFIVTNVQKVSMYFSAILSIFGALSIFSFPIIFVK